MAVYTAQIELATRLIKEKGKALVLRRSLGTTPTLADEPWKPAPAAPTDFAFQGVLLDKAMLHKPGSKIIEGSQFILVSVFAAVPTPADIMVDGSELWQIISVETLAPNGEHIIHELQVKQ
jgi:hypothetical protein